MTSFALQPTRAALCRAAFTSTAVALAVSACFPSSAWAQTADNAGNADRQTVVVTATRNPQAASDVLSDNIVITSQEIQQSGQTNLVDLLQQQRGIEIATYGGPGSAASVMIRGTTSNENIVLVDGVRIGSSLTGSATWENIPLSQIDHIEIVYGPLSSLYGADALGGVVQIFTKQGEGAPHPSVTIGYGSYGTRTVDASVVGASAGGVKIRYALDVNRDESNGFAFTAPNNAYLYNPGKNGYDKDGVSGKLSVDVATGHTVGVSFLQSQNDVQWDADNVAVAPEIEKLSSYTLYSHDRFLPNWTSSLQLAQSEDKSWYGNGPNWLADYYGTPTNTFDTTQTNFSWQNDIALGANLLQLIAERRQENVNTNVGIAGARDTNSIAASYQWKSGNQLGVVSIRDDDSSQFGSKTTGSLAYGVRLSGAWRVNASLATSFREPTFDDLYYPGSGISTLKPEEGKDAEIGTYYDDGKSQASAVYYHNQITDKLQSYYPCPVDPTINYNGCTLNVDHALLSGLSLGGRTRLGNFSLHGSLDFQDPRDEITNTMLARNARHHGSIGVDYQQGAVQAGVDSVFSGKRYDDEANTVVLAGYGLLNLHASVELNDDWTLIGRWNNVLNKDYQLISGYATSGSNLYVALRYGFK